MPPNQPEQPKIPETPAEKTKKEPRFREAQDFINSQPNLRDGNADSFHLQEAIDYLKEKEPGNKNRAAMLEAKRILEPWAQIDLLDEEKPEEFKKRLDALLKDRNETDPALRKKLDDAYSAYRPLREYFRSLMQTQKNIDATLQETKPEGKKDSFSDKMGDIWQDAKRNFKNLSGTNQLILLAGGLFGAAFLLNADAESGNPRTELWRERLFNVGKFGGALYFGNLLVKLFTGKSVVERIEGEPQADPSKQRWWKETYPKAPAEKSEALRKFLIYGGDLAFTEVAKAYRDTKAMKQHEIDLGLGGKMSAQETYDAIDLFFQKHDRKDPKKKKLEDLPQYRDLNFLEVFTDQERISVPGDVAERADALAAESLRGGYESTDKPKEGGVWNWCKDLYRKTFGKEGNDDEVKNWREAVLPKNVTRREDLAQFLRSGNPSPASAEGFVKAIDLKTSTEEPVHHLRFFVDDQPGSTRSIYISAEADPKLIGNKEELFKAITEADANARKFLEKKYPVVKGHVDQFAEFWKSAFVDGKVLVFMKMYLPGSQGFYMRGSGIAPAPEKFGNPHEFFDESHKIDYKKMKPAQQEQFRLHFMVDAKEGKMIADICEFLTRRYQTSSPPLPLEAAMARPLERANEDDLKAAQEALRYKQSFSEENVLKLKQIEAKLAGIEKDIAEDATPTDEQEVLLHKQLDETTSQKARLAILGDSEAQKYWTDSFPTMPRDIFSKPEEFADWYKEMLKQKYPAVDGFLRRMF